METREEVCSVVSEETYKLTRFEIGYLSKWVDAFGILVKAIIVIFEIRITSMNTLLGAVQLTAINPF